MPGNLASFSNPGGMPVATSADEFYQRQQLAAKAAQQQDASLAAMLSEGAANRAQQINVMGSYADKSRDALNLQRAGYDHDLELQGMRGKNALDVGKQSGDFGLQNIYAGNVPEMERIGLQKQEYNDTRADGASQRELAGIYAGAEKNTVGKLFADQGASVVPGTAPAPQSQDEIFERLMYLKNPTAFAESRRRAEDRADSRDSADTQAFTTMAASTDPRVRAVGIAGLQKTRAFGQLPSGTLQNLAKPLVSAGENFLAQPVVAAEVQAIGSELAAAGNDTNAESLAQALKPRIDRLVARAAEDGADPNQVLQSILGQLGKMAPAADLWSNPITTTLGAIPGVRNFVPTPSRDASRRVVGL